MALLKPDSRKRKRSEDGSRQDEDAVVVDVKKLKEESDTSDEDVNNYLKGDSMTQTKNKKKRKRESEEEEEDDDEIEESQPKKEKKSKKGEKTPTTQSEDDAVNAIEGQTKMKGNKEKNNTPKDDVDMTENEGKEKTQENETRTEKLISSVLTYLHEWKKDVKSWKFNKYYQSCLINYVNDPTIVNEGDFEVCLQYFKKCRGNGKKKLKMKSMALLRNDSKSGSKAAEQKTNKTAPEQRNDDCTLFVKNLPYGQTKEEIRSGLFRIFPNAKDIRMPFASSAKYVGFAFIEFKEPSEVTAAISKKAVLGTRPLFLDRVGDKNRSRKSVKGDQSLSAEFVDAEMRKRAKRVVEMFGGNISEFVDN